MITGALNWKRSDQTLERSQVFPVQLITPKGEIVHIPFFQDWGEVGVASIVWDSVKPAIWYCATGENIYHFNLETGKRREIPIPVLAGVHEMAFIEHKLWVSNTLYDEVICYNPAKDEIEDRLQLSKLWHPNNSTSEVDAVETGMELKSNKYHCNQIFKDFEDRLCCLVHHTSGEQLLKKYANKVIKLQGSGGILYLDGGKPLNLGLHAPHSVRMVGDCYWVMDSGTNNLRVYDSTWQLKETAPTGGWGRGAAIAEDQKLAYIGISSTRKRYLGLFKGEGNENAVLQFNVDSLECIRKWTIPHVEQINNVYLIHRDIAQALLAL